MKKNRKTWWLVFLLAASPSIYFALAYLFKPMALGIDPVETILQESGEWALRLLILSLACSPLKRVGLKQVMKFRRMLGLYSFYYASIHLGVYVGGWIQWDWSEFFEDLVSRPFIYLGMFAWLILLILALTSPKRMVRWLKRKWLLIHKLVYLAIVLVCIHLWMQSRASAFEPLVYAVLASMLLCERIYQSSRKRLLANRLL